MPTGIRWTEEEEDYLQQLLSQSLKHAEIAEQLTARFGRPFSRASVDRKLARMRKVGDIEPSNHSHVLWTEEEKQYLRDIYWQDSYEGLRTYAELAMWMEEEFKRPFTESSVSYMICKMYRDGEIDWTVNGKAFLMPGG
ncbi:hypothetical protein MMC20_005010 [Loxospora ochrophaea]|nr:hypothetical protein [Loxospora ochrophaea]